MRRCEWCDLAEEEKHWMLFESKYWSVYLADVQDYIGRCILVLNRHRGSISELCMEEWVELKEIIDRLEQCYKEVLGAELCNWSCLMNSFYKEAAPDPHLHIHVRPRYKTSVVINNNSYADAEYGHHYALKKDVQLIDEDRITLYKSMKHNLELAEVVKG